ncbi:autotransporter-associated beta strand repeat-containing protein [Prosthecobacter sp.]|uniref:beta strand repeat-containing protein n=1 Tax=Prosthecobacter sp. TaxID=1965333 RepID=UPI001E07CCE0|nr:autotransporter-associated beta strand repeat-containing protein [Prosthecobacter sp.]MCB1275555.1 autotransporter-associated beta strand repeat-containing protein [Prosthecobacter sp.]
MDASSAGNNANGTNLGGTGTWDISTANWWDGINDVAWPNSFFDTAIFNGTAGTVTLSSAINVGTLRFDTSNYVITSDTLNLGGVGRIEVNGLGGTIGSTGARATIESAIAGTSGLSKEGSGVLVLTNNSNTYTGATVVKNGTLSISNMGQLGASTSTVGVYGVSSLGWAGGTLQLQGGTAAGTGLTFNRNLSLSGRGSNGFGTSFQSIGNNIINGNIVTSSITETRLVATGGTTIINGNLQLGSADIGQIIYGNGNVVINGLITGGTSGQIHLVKTTSGIASTLTLTNSNNTFLGATRADSGTIRISDGGQLGRSTSNNIAPITFNGGTYEIRTDTPNSFSGINISYSSNNGTIFVDRAIGSSSSLINQTVAFNNLRQENNRTFTFTGRNGYGLSIASLTNNANGANNEAWNYTGNGTMTVNGTSIWSEANTAGARTLTFTATGEMVINPNIIASGNSHVVTKSGTGTLTLNGTASTYTGATNISAGTLALGNVGAVATTSQINIGNATTTSGALTYLGGTATLDRNILINSTTASAYINANGTGALTLTGNILTTVNGAKTLFLGGTNTDDNTLASAFGNSTSAHNLQKIGAGTWLLTAANTYTGTTTVSNGTLKVQDTFSGASRNVINDGSALTFNVDTFTNAAGGTFEYLGDGANASAETLGALTATAGAGTIKVTAGAGGTADLTFASLTTPAAGTGINFVTNAGGTVTLTGATDTNGILNAHVFFNGADFASGSAVTAATYTTESAGASLAGGNSTPYLVDTTDIAAQATATINAGIKFVDNRNFTLGASQTLTLQNGAATVSGGILVTGGSTVTISGGTGITSGGAADLVFRTDAAGDTLILNTAITNTTTGGWTKLGAGTLVLGAANAGTAAGQVHINEGTVQLSGSGRLGADSMDVRLRQGATLDLNGVNLGTAASGTAAIDELNGAGTVKNSGVAASLRVGNANASSYFTGSIQDNIALVKNGSGTFRLAGAQTYSGGVTINAGTLTVNTLANFGDASGLGAGITGDNAGSLVFNGGILNYTGEDTVIYQTTGTPSVSIDRLFTLAGDGRINSNGSAGQNALQTRAANNAALIFNNTADIAFSGSGVRLLTLGGDSLGDNEMKIGLRDNGASALSITKADGGLWILSNANNDYSGATTISAGVLRIESSAYSTNTNTVLAGGILESSGTFTRAIGTGANQIQWTGTSNSGFAASVASLVVNLGGGTPITWGSTASFSSTGQLLLNSTTALADVNFANDIDLNAAVRTVNVADNTSTGTDFAILSGTLSGTGSSGLTKTGNGLLYITGNNTYNGNTTVSLGQLAVTSIDGTSGSSNLGNASGSLTLGNTTTATTYLMYYGTGETVARSIIWNSTTGTTTIDSSGSGALVINNFSITGNGSKTLNLRGFNTDANTISSNIGNVGGTTSVTKSDSGTWILSGNNTFTGNLTVNTGWLGLADATSAGSAGTGALVLSNGGIFAAGGTALSISRELQLAANASSLFTGDQSITFTGTVKGNAGSDNQVWNIYNTLSSGATLTFNSFTSVEDTATDTRPLVILGTGATVFDATIANQATVTDPNADGTSLTLSTSNNGSLTLSGASPNTYSRGTTLTQGTLILGKVGALGSGTFNFNGGVLQATVDLSGADKLTNAVTLASAPGVVSGSQNIEFGGVVTNSGGDRALENNLSGAQLTLSGGVNLSNDGTNRTFSVQGSGDTIINSVIVNGSTSTASALRMRGTGTLTLTAANTYDGGTTVTNGVLKLSDNGTLDQNSIITVSGKGTLRLDNSVTNLGDRVSDTQDINIDGGLLDFISDGSSSSESFGRLDINGNGLATIKVSGGGSSTLTFLSVNFANTGSTLDVSGISSLGTTNKVLFTTAPTGTAVANGMLPKVVFGADFAEYDVTNGIQAFSGYNNSNDLVAAVNTDTMNVTSSANISVSRTLNALKLAGGVTVGSSIAGSQLTLSGGAVLVDGGVNVLNVPLLNLGANNGYFQVTTGTTLNIDSTMTGAAYTQLQGGTVNFNTTQFYVSTTNIHGGTLKLNGGLNTIMPLKQSLFVNPGATLDLNGNTQFVGNITTSSDQPDGGGTIMTSTGTGTIVTDNGGSWMGTITGSINLGRVGGSTLTIGTAQSYTGWTFLTASTTTLRDNATILNTSGIDINLATLFLGNNDNLQIQINDRVKDDAAINLRGGTISVTGRAHTDATERMGAVSVLMGANTITSTAGGTGSYNSSTVTFASLTRSAGATVNFTGTSLGQAGNNGFIKFDTPLATVSDLLLGNWAIANTTDYAAYAHGMGVGAVGTPGYTPYATQEINDVIVTPDAGIFASGAVTNIVAQAAGSIQLPSGTTTTGLLRIAGGFTNDIVFTSGTDVLNLELGGILRSNNNNATTIGTLATRGIITSGVSELVIYNNQNTLTIHSVIQGTNSLVKAGGGTLTLSAQNSYSGGTVVNQGTLRLEGDVGFTVIPAGGLTITGSTVTMINNQGQIDSSNIVTLNGSSTLTLVGNNTLDSIVFNHVGGTTAPTVTSGGVLTLTNANAVTVTSNNAIGLPVINGTLDIGASAKIFSVDAPQMNGVVYDNSINPSLSIGAVVTGAGGSITKTGTGLLLLGGQSTFTGGMTVTGGGIVLAASSTSTFANSLFSGPLGLGAVSMAAGTKVAVNDSSRTVANAMSFAGNPIFSNTGSTLDTLTLNGALTFSTLSTPGGLVAEIDTPYLNVVLGGDIQGIGSVTAVGSTGANTISKTGPGNLSGLNLTGLGSSVPINLTNLTNTSFTLLHDGDGTSGFETINLGTVTWESVNGALNLTIGRAGAGLYFPTAAFKTIALTSLNSSGLPSGIVLTNNNGYGLDIPDNIVLAVGNSWSVSTTNTSLQTVGLTLSGEISGSTGLTKAGNGVLKLSNAANSFTGTIDITNGTVEGALDTVFGNPSNIIQIGSNSLTEGLRISGTFATSRTINLNNTNSGIDVTGSNVFTLNSAFTFATATNNLQKNDRGTLVLTQAQSGWDGVFTVKQGVVRISNADALGTTTGNTTFGNVGAALELTGSITLAEPLLFASGDDVMSNGVNGGGALRSVSGDNILTGDITLNNASGTNDRSRGATITVDSGATLDIQGVITGNVGNGQNRDSILGLGGDGNGTLSTALALGGTLGTNRYFLINKFGSGTWTITAANAHPGTRVVIKEGMLTLSGSGSLGTPTAGQETTPTVYLNPTGVLKLDSGTGTAVDDRLSGRALNVSGADVIIIGNAAGTSETVGAFTLREGLSIFTLDAHASGQLNFATGAITRSTGASLLIRADNFGSAAGTGVATFTGSSYAFVGQLGDTDTTNKAIIPWALGDSNVAGGGTGFVTADSTGGAANTGTNILRLLSPSEQTTDFATANANVNLSTTELLGALNNYNSLRLASGGGVDLNYVPLSLASGGLLALSGNTGIDGFSGVSYLTTVGNAELVIHAVGDLVLNVPIAGTTGALTKSGAGALTLTAGNTAHGTVYVNDGTLMLGGGNQTILPGRSLQVNNGGTLDLNGTAQHFNLLESRLTAVLAQSDLFPGDSGGIVTNSSGTQATLALATGNVTFTGSIQGNVAVVHSQAAAAFQDWNLYSEQTYSGPSLFNGGRTQLLVEGRLTNTSSIEIANATFLIATTNGNTEGQNVSDRVKDTAPITLRGGNLQLRGHAALYTTETLGAVTLGSGQNVIDAAEGGTPVDQSDFTIASLTRAANSHATLRFYNIDGTPNDDARLFITAAPTLTNNIIGGWAVFEREFASYISGHGVGGLNTQGFAGYSPNLINDGTGTDNIRIALPAAGSTTLLTADRTIYSLNLQGASSSTANSNLDLGGNTLTLVSGGLIASGATNDIFINITNGNLTAGALNVGGDLYLHTFGYVNGNTDVVNRDVNISANLVNNGTGAVTVVYNGDDGRGTGLDGLLNASSTNVTGNNTYTGGTFVNAGRVILNNASANGTTITATGTGDLTIHGGPSTNGNTYQEFRSSVVYGSSDQIANTATVTLIGSGRLNLNNFSQTIAALVFNNIGGHNPEVTTGTGTLTVTGSSITASGQNASTSAISTINGKLALSAATTTFTINPVEWNGAILNPILPNLIINASIEGADIVKNGNGVLRLTASNAFTGSFDLQAGGLALGSNNALSTGSLIIGNGTFLTSTADNRIIANSYSVTGDFALRDAFNLTLSGDGTLAAGNHDISVDLAAKTLTLSGVLGGATANINKTGDGILVLGSSNNTYGGTTTVTDGILRYGVANAIPTGSAVSVLQGALLDITLGGSAVTVGSLSSDSATLGGVVYHGDTSGTNTLTAGGDNTTTSFGGVIANATGSTLNFVKDGTGTLTLGGANQYNGSTTVAGGRLIAQPVGGNSPLGTSQSLIMGGASTAGILQLGNGTGALSHTFTSLSSQGTATTNQIVSGNATMATLILDLAANSVFAGNIGGSGTNEANLNLVKSGAGDLTISGTGTSMYNGTTTVNGGKLFMDTPGAFAATTTSLTLADGTEFSLRGTTNAANQVFGFSGSGNVITVGSSTGATLGFGIDGVFNSQLSLATGQTMTVNGTLTTAVYVNSAPTDGLDYILINGADASSLHAGSGTFDLNPVIFNGGSFSYALRNETLGGTVDQWILTPTAVPAAADTWWKGDLTGIGTGVWSATTTSGTGFPSNWDTDQSSGIDALVPPDAGSIVHFSATGAANFTTTLGANVTIQELIFHTGNSATSIGSSNGINTLTLGNTVDASGLTIQTGAADVSISAIVNLAQNQSWNIEDSARLLTLSGSLTGTAIALTVNDSVTNAGSLVFTGSAASLTGTLNMNAGTLLFDGTGSLNSGLDVVLGTVSTAATLKVGDAGAASGATIGGLSNGSFAGSRVIGGNASLSTLAIGPSSGTATFSGDLGGVGTNENQFNLEKTGAGTQIISGTTITYAGNTTVREGVLQLGSTAVFAPTGSLSVIANAGVTAAFDFNGKSFTTIGTLTLGGGASGQAQVLDTNGTKGTLTLGGDITYDASNNPGNATISANLNTTGANRVVTVGDSTNSTNELTISGTITSTSNNSLTLAGAGNGTISGNISLNPAGGATSSRDFVFNSTGTWDVNAKIEAGDDLLLNTGTINANVGESLDATDDIVIDGTGTQGSMVVNIYSTSQVHTGDDIFIRNGGQINIYGAGGIGTGTDQLLIGDSASNSAAAAGLLNFAANVNISTTSGFQLGATGGQLGNITGTGTFTSAGTKDLRNGSIGDGVTLAGNGAITKQTTGTVTFSGARAGASTGATNIFEGTLILDYTTNNNSKIGGVLTLGQLNNVSNGTLQLNGNDAGATSQSVTSTTISTGNTTVAINNGTGQTATLNLGAITRTVGGVVSFEYLSANAGATSTSPAGTLGYATLSIAGGSDRFAAIDGSGNIVQATLTTQNDVTLWATGQNIINDAAFAGVVDCANIASLTFNGISANNTLSLTSTGDLLISSGGIMVDPSVGAFSSTISGGRLLGATNSGIAGEIIIQQNNTVGLLTIASKIIKSAGITKSGFGTVLLSGANSFLNTGSQLVINEGTVRISGGNALADNMSVYMRQGTTFDVNNSTEVVGHLVTESNGTIALGTSGKLTFNQTGNISYRGLFTGGATSQLTLNGPLFNFNITGSTTSAFTGAVVVNTGLLQLSGSAGRLSGVLSFTINKGGTMLIDNNDDSAPNDRISDSAAFTLHSADGTPSGEVARPRGLWIRSDNSNGEDETIGALTFASGASYATLDANTTNAAAVTRLISSGWTRNAGATINVRGRNLGATANQRTGFKIADANDSAFMAANLIGGSGGAGTDTRSIVPWAMGENMTVGGATDTNMGNTLLTYVDNVGFVPLSFTNEYSTFAAKDSNDDNIRESLTADLTGLVGQTINSLVIHNNSTSASTINVTGAGAGHALINSSGTFLFTQNTAAAASTVHSVVLGGFVDGIQVGATNEYVFFVVNPSAATNTATLTATVASPLNTTGASVTKSGRGTLEFTAVNTYTGGTTVNEGTLLIHDNDNIGSGGLSLAGGTLSLASDFADDIGGRNLVVQIGGGTLDVQASSVTATNLVTSGSGTLTKTGTGTLTIAGGTANTQTGDFAVTRGLVELGKTAGVNAISGANLLIGFNATTNQTSTVRLLANNQIANATSVSLRSAATGSVATFDLNGFSDTIGSLTMGATTGSGVLLTTGAGGVLTVSGDIVLNSDRALNDASTNARNIVITGTGSIATAAPDSGTLNLGSVTRTITVQTVATGSNLGNNDATIETAITGTGSAGIIKEGSQALVLSGTNTYLGATTINDGEINLRGSLSSGAVTVSEVGGTLANAAVLSGSGDGVTTGIIGGTVTIGEVDCGVGILAPGTVASTTTLISNYGANANGTLTLTAGGVALTVADGSQIQLGITNATYTSLGLVAALGDGSATDASSYIASNLTELASNWNVAPTSSSDMDYLNLTGSGSNLSLGSRVSATFGDGVVRVSVVGSPTFAQGQVFNLIDWQAASIMGGTFSTGTSTIYGAASNVIAGDLDLPSLGAGLAWDVSAFTQYGVIVVVPEPSRAVLLLLGLLGFAMRRRR